MDKSQILKIYNDFLLTYNEDEKTNIWDNQSELFRSFWSNSIMDKKIKEINDAEIDDIIKILDRHGKGNTPSDEAVAMAMIAQGAWRRMFKDIKEQEKLRTILNRIFLEEDENKKADLIDELYEINKDRKNSLTGKSGNALNAMLFVFNPDKHISVISLKDRRKIIEFFNFDGEAFDCDSQGKKIVLSSKAIIDGVSLLNIVGTPRTISLFFYQPGIKDHWRKEFADDYEPWSGGNKEVQKLEDSGDRLFYMESQLEDFLIENWDTTELGKKYDLVEEEDEMVSQQYKTDIGRIDILACDKKTKQYIVIELKKNQTSDDTVGQLTRYMGWLEEHKTEGKPTKGIIIAAQYDQRLYYALKKVKDVEVYLYRVDFRLEEFKKL